MTHRERMLTSLKRQQPDRVPVDLGGTLASTLNVHTYRRLMTHLGFGDDPPVAFLSRRSNSVLPDERLLHRLDVDCRAVILGNPDLHPERELPDGSLTDEWQITWKHIGEGQHFINAGGPFSDKTERRRCSVRASASTSRSFSSPWTATSSGERSRSSRTTNSAAP